MAATHYLPSADGYVSSSVKPGSIGPSIRRQKNTTNMLTSNSMLWAYFLTVSLFIVDIPKPVEGLLVEILWVLVKTYVVGIFFWTLWALVRELMKVLQEEATPRGRRQL